MKLYIVRAEDWDYDEYDSVVVIAKDEESAKKESNILLLGGEENISSVEYIGESCSDEPGIVHASFNAG